MTAYIVNYPVQDGMGPCGPYGTLEETQLMVQGLAEAYIATDPTHLSLQSTPMLYVVIKNVTNIRVRNGISYTSSLQILDKKWEIVALVS